MNVVRIALDVPVDELFDYYEGEAVPVGALVVVPFGRRHAVGVALEHGSESRVPAERVRRIQRILPAPILPPETLALAKFCAQYYHAPIGQVLAAILPTALRRPGFRPSATSWLYRLTTVGSGVDIDSLPARAAAARRLLHEFKRTDSLTSEQMRALSSRARVLVRGWLERGWVERVAPHPKPPLPSAVQDRRPPPTLTSDQQSAVEQISAQRGQFSPWLLEGITGSGKTEVYLRLAERVFAHDGQVLLLVPEINLTPQLEARLKERFPAAELVSLHSGLGEGERLARWIRACRGEAQLVLGTRLAVFTPMPRVGLVIVDEEHDASYKQQEGVRYHARDVAVLLARERQVPIVLGSATPSLETVFNARKGRFGHLTLNERPSATLPAVQLIDAGKGTRPEPLPPPVVSAIERRLAGREQVLVFINRRGYAPILMCRACGWSAHCPRCTARLTLHLREHRLRCHCCGHRAGIHARCPDCGNQDLRGLGHGTQRLEESLTARFPHARVLRVDSDTTRRRHSFSRMREQIHDESVDIIVGTQMLAKGHDFPKLTLVVVVGADLMLFSTDFRAPERLYQQLTQVSGRAGRSSLPGEVLVLTQFPQHPLYQSLLRHDFGGFAEVQLEERERCGFPPFMHQAMLRGESVGEKALAVFFSMAAQAAVTLAKGVTVYDPVPAPRARLAGRYRWQLLVQAQNRGTLQRFLQQWLQQLRGDRSRRVKWVIDVDPIET